VVSSTAGYLDCAALFCILRFSHAWRRFPLAPVFQWFLATLQKAPPHTQKSPNAERGGAVQIGALNPQWPATIARHGIPVIVLFSGAFPLRPCSSGFSPHYRKRRHARKSHRMPNGGGALQI